MSRRLQHAAIVGLVVISVGCGGASISLPTAPESPAPSVSVSSVSPDIGPINGDVVIRIVGAGFRADANVLIGDSAAQVTDVKPGAITAITAPHAAGTVDVIVTNPDG